MKKGCHRKPAQKLVNKPAVYQHLSVGPAESELCLNLLGKEILFVFQFLRNHLGHHVQL